jgi:hypothetical protein
VHDTRANDADWAGITGRATGDTQAVWWDVWDTLSVGMECIIVHDSSSDLQVDTHDYEVVKLWEPTAWDQFAQQQAALLAGRLFRKGDQLGQARSVDRRGFDDGLVAHGSSSASVWGRARTLPSVPRSRVGGASGWARSVEVGVWAICTGRASR